MLITIKSLSHVGNLQRPDFSHGISTATHELTSSENREQVKDHLNLERKELSGLHQIERQKVLDMPILSILWKTLVSKAEFLGLVNF